MSVCVCTCVCTRAHVSVHVRMCVYTCVYTHMYRTHTHTHRHLINSEHGILHGILVWPTVLAGEAALVHPRGLGTGGGGGQHLPKKLKPVTSEPCLCSERTQTQRCWAQEFADVSSVRCRTAGSSVN